MSIKKKLEDITTDINKASVFECEFSNLSEDANVEWYHNGKLATDMKKYKISRDGDRCSFKIFNCQYTDTGTVEVKVSECSSQAKISVPKPEIGIINLTPLVQEVSIGDDLVMKIETVGHGT